MIFCNKLDFQKTQRVPFAISPQKSSHFNNLRPSVFSMWHFSELLLSNPPQGLLETKRFGCITIVFLSFSALCDLPETFIKTFFWNFEKQLPQFFVFPKFAVGEKVVFESYAYTLGVIYWHCKIDELSTKVFCCIFENLHFEPWMTRRLVPFPACSSLGPKNSVVEAIG